MEPIEKLGEVIEALRPLQGQPLRCTALARDLGLSRFQVWRCLERLESRGILYSLPAWCPPPLHPGRRLVRSPVVYLRETPGREPEHYLRSCERCSLEAEVSYRSRMIEHLILLERTRNPASRFGHYSTPAMSRAALVVAAPLITVGYQFPFHPCPGKRRWTGLRKSIGEGWIDRGLVVYPGSRAFFGARGVAAVPAAGLLAGYRMWMDALETGDPDVLRRQVRASNATLHLGCFAHLRAGKRAGEDPEATGSPA